ncbi:alcohol dehydrogenase catalytic domain-containing protein [Paenibacillus sp. P26]|nr:alcohol dehydrogenase catalytic domain-containing protein [Paenibacillus sp. P26]
MKSYHANLGAGLEGLVVKEQDVPVPGPGEVLVKVRACSLNYREIMIIFTGFYSLPIKPDVIPVSDGAGEVVEVGEGVTRVGPGTGWPAPYFRIGSTVPSVGSAPRSSADRWTAC